MCKRWMGGGGGGFGLLQQLVGCWAGFHGNMCKKSASFIPQSRIDALYKRIRFFFLVCVSLIRLLTQTEKLKKHAIKMAAIKIWTFHHHFMNKCAKIRRCFNWAPHPNSYSSKRQWLIGEGVGGLCGICCYSQSALTGGLILCNAWGNPPQDSCGSAHKNSFLWAYRAYTYRGDYPKEIISSYCRTNSQK